MGGFDHFEECIFQVPGVIPRAKLCGRAYAQHFSASLQLIDPTHDGTLTQQLFVVYNGIRILEDFTGFLLDPADALEYVYASGPQPRKGTA